MADVKIIEDGEGIFVLVDSLKIARRGNADSLEAGTWVSIEPGWEVVDNPDDETIAVRYNGAGVH